MYKTRVKAVGFTDFLSVTCQLMILGFISGGAAVESDKWRSELLCPALTWFTLLLILGVLSMQLSATYEMIQKTKTRSTRNEFDRAIKRWTRCNIWTATSGPIWYLLFGIPLFTLSGWPAAPPFFFFFLNCVIRILLHQEIKKIVVEAAHRNQIVEVVAV